MARCRAPLTNLAWLRLAFNQLEGCVPEFAVPHNDFPVLGLPFCASLADREVLIAFYRTNGANWHNNQNWLSEFICIEEPENGLYHRLLEVLAAEFRRHATGRRNAPQVFVTTHQPYFVDCAQSR